MFRIIVSSQNREAARSQAWRSQRWAEWALSSKDWQSESQSLLIQALGLYLTVFTLGKVSPTGVSCIQALLKTDLP